MPHRRQCQPVVPQRDLVRAGEVDYVQGAYAVANLAFKIAPESEKWHVGLWARNLFDQHYPVGFNF